jgi:nitrous oxidase accessory protein
MLAKRPELRLFQHSPAADALDLAAKAFPVFRPRPIMADPHPVVQQADPPPLPAAPGLEAPSPLIGGLASAAMVALALMVLAFGARSFGRKAARAGKPF